MTLVSSLSISPPTRDISDEIQRERDGGLIGSMKGDIRVMREEKGDTGVMREIENGDFNQ